MGRFSTLNAAAWFVLVVPVAAIAAPCAGFTDVDDSSGFCTSIAWMKNRAITLGCTSTQYCPDDFVRRDQMAAFMYRLGFQNAFLNGGNGFGTTAVLGTTDDQALDVRANGGRTMRYEPNAISPNVIGGSPANSATTGVRGATIGGGGVPVGDTDPDLGEEAPNRVTDHYGTVGGGYGNRAGDDTGTFTDAPFATVGGGAGNTAGGFASTVGGGAENTASGFWSAVGGGSLNTASSSSGTVGGGSNNTASGFAGTVAGGTNNVASSVASTIGGGWSNNASGSFSTVAGGKDNNAAGDYSIAMGTRALTTANAMGSFVFSDSTGTASFGSDQPNEFLVAATGGIGMWTQKDYNTGCKIPAGSGSWTCSSSRDIKRDFAPIDTSAVLSKVVALPITTWRYRAEDGARHLGPMAQDFRSAFGLGADDISIASVDANGVTLGAIQGLNAKVDSVVAAKDVEIAALEDRLAKVEASHAREIAELRIAIEVLLVRMSTEKRVVQTR